MKEQTRGVDGVFDKLIADSNFCKDMKLSARNEKPKAKSDLYQIFKRELEKKKRVNTTPDDYYASYYNRGHNEGIDKSIEVLGRMLGEK